MRILIVDDEAPAREELQWLLEQCEVDVEVVAQAPSATNALSLMQEMGDEIDLVFLDVDMPGINGVRLAELWHEQKQASGPMVVFVTAYQEYAVDAFDVDAVDYLLKPVRLERLQRALTKAQARLEVTPHTEEVIPQRALSRISVEDRGVYRVLPIEDILFFEAEDGIVVAQTAQGRYITEFSLKFLQNNLSTQDFFRCHRSYIIKLNTIESIAPWGAGTYRLILDRDADLGVPLARSRASELKSLIPWSASVFDDS